MRRGQLLVPAMLALFVGVPAAVVTLETNGVDVPGVSSVKSLLSMMEERSPGERTAGELTKTKHRKLADAPHQRALGKIHQPAPPKEFVEALTPPVQETVVPTVALQEPLLAALAPPAAAPLSPPSGGGGTIPGGGGPGGGGGNPGGGGEEPPPPPPPPPPPAVPEPGTWAMMLVGFGSMGLALRRRRRLDSRSLLPSA